MSKYKVLKEENKVDITMLLKQDDLAKLLEVPKSRISEYLKGKRDITLDVARNRTAEAVAH